MAATIQLNATKRTVMGRKVKQLRAQGKVPANVYGHKVESEALTLDWMEFKEVYRHAGETHIVDLAIEGETKKRPVLIYSVQTHPISRKVLHIDLRQVNLKEKIETAIDLELVGESRAEALGLVVLKVRDQVDVEALPTELPEKFELDVTNLETVEDTLTVADIKVDPEKVKILLEPEEVLVRVEAPKEEPVEEAPAEEATPAETPEGSEQPKE